MRKHNDRFRGQEYVTVYGRRAVVEALTAETVEVERVRLAREIPAEFRREVTAACRERGLEAEMVGLREVAETSGDSRNDQGVVARIRLKNVMDLDVYLESLSGSRAKQATRLLALDGVTNPQNVGMIVRSAVASGMDGLIWPMAGSPWVNGLIVKSSAATVYRCPILKCESLVEGLWSLKRAGFRVFGLHMQGGTNLFEVEGAHRAVHIIGRETEGLSPEVLELVDERVSIPMQGGVESLNAAVAAALVCFHAARPSSGIV